MGFYTTTSVTEKPHPETPSCAQKTASGKIFTYPIKTQYKNRHNSLKTKQEKPLPTHEIASGVFYYKYRHYSAELGRWPSRDPIEEKGGVNLYAFVGNQSLMRWDSLGLKSKTYEVREVLEQKGIDQIIGKIEVETVINTSGCSTLNLFGYDFCIGDIEIEFTFKYTGLHESIQNSPGVGPGVAGDTRMPVIHNPSTNEAAYMDWNGEKNPQGGRITKNSTISGKVAIGKLKCRGDSIKGQIDVAIMDHIRTRPGEEPNSVKNGKLNINHPGLYIIGYSFPFEIEIGCCGKVKKDELSGVTGANAQQIRRNNGRPAESLTEIP